MSVESFSGHWMIAVAEAAALAGFESLDEASASAVAQAWDIVSEAFGLTHAQLAEGIAAQHHLGLADVSGAESHAARLLPGALARRRGVLPLSHTARELVVATANPLSVDTMREIAEFSSREVEFRVAPPREIADAVLETYGPPDDDEVEARALPAERTGPHILVVDDEAGTRLLYSAVLERAGFRVSVARDGPEALELLREDDSVDLVTLDYWMDKMNGLRVLQLMHAHPALARLPVVMVTGADSREIEMSLFEAGADDYIAKPVDPPLLILRIRAVLRRRQLS